ncbi:MAG TPA: alkaline phosphatase PhoX [Opitutus sp.]|nr:alkaline phosphatase PhoX [Opitutus sp.]
MHTRREFLRQAALFSTAFVGLRQLASSPLWAVDGTSASAGFGPLLDDPAGLLRLPRGFRYTKFSATGDEMTDGLLVPGKHDGMAAFPGPDGRTLLVRNHELESAWSDLSPFGADRARIARVSAEKIYDRGRGTAPNLGGTTTLVFNPRTQQLESHFLSLAGTLRNCAGGPTPWGTWVTCEEINATPEPDAEQPHGYNFEVTPSALPGLVDPVPLKAMGRFRHEAIAVDPASGVVYQTEDLGDGLLYRFIPHRPGQLAAGGRLQALAIAGWKTADTTNWTERRFPIGSPQRVTWIDLDDVESPAGDLRLRGAAAGAAIFGRGEGAWHGNDSVYFAMTEGGAARLGQIFRYRPSPYEGTPREREQPPTLELFAEPNDAALLRNCDNVTVAPWGDLVLCEDTSGPCRLVGVTPQGKYYVIGANTESGRELAGACFSPDGSTLFVNVQTPGFTLAITGPWHTRGPG